MDPVMLLILVVVGAGVVAALRPPPSPPTIVYVPMPTPQSARGGGCLWLVALAFVALLLLGGLAPV